MPYTVVQHFEGRSQAIPAIYASLLNALRRLGPVEEDPKKTSIHLNRRTAFAGVATRKDMLVLTIKAPSDIKSKRIDKHEQVSANRWHLEVRLVDPDEVDSELMTWLAAAYAMSE